MSIEWDEIRYRWEHCHPVEGVAFLPNDRAVVTAGSHRGRLVRVLALRAIQPQPEFDVEVVDGGERLPLSQSELASPVPDGLAESIGWIQKWYASQCDGDWEHGNGISIGTLDNPGWSITVNLEGTELEAALFAEVTRLEPERAWLACKIEEKQWRGVGGPHMLAEILDTFVRWARGIVPGEQTAGGAAAVDER
jgi:hypothetical protein